MSPDGAASQIVQVPNRASMGELCSVELKTGRQTLIADDVIETREAACDVEGAASIGREAHVLHLLPVSDALSKTKKQEVGVLSINERLWEAAVIGCEVELKALLASPSCDALSKNKYGMAPLMLAARYGHEACVDLLLPVSDALSTDNDGHTALIWAAINGHDACVRLLLPASKVRAKCKSGTPALIWAAYHGREGCISLLLPASNALDKDDCGMTALMHAARYGYGGCVRLLLPTSDTLVKGPLNFTASDWAREANNKSLAHLIDGYTLAQKEKADIERAVSSALPSQSSVPRV